jgi:hypothetical protein
MRTVTVAGHQFELSAGTIERSLEQSLPEPVRDHFVVISGRRWPPKQVLALATGLDRADFTTHQARRTLTRLGFTAGRAPRPGAPHPAPAPVRDDATETPSLAEVLRPFAGQWVAVREDELVVAAPSPRQVVAWLAEHGQQAQSVFRVPTTEAEVGGAAPL